MSSRRLFQAVTAVLIAAAPVVAADPAHAATGSYIRLAHLSPDTPNVDVYLTAFARPDFNVTLRGVGYGDVSPYQRIEPGQYTVSMRAAGAAAESPPVISTNVQIASGAARTVAGVGRFSSLGLAILDDDLRLPPAGQARVRIIQASARVPSLNVKATGGPVIATAATFATTTPYAVVPAGRWSLELGPSAGNVTARSAVDLEAGAVYSVIVLDAKSTGLQVVSRLDARGAQVVPAGGVATGLGGTATPRWPLAALLTLALLAAGLAGWLRYSREASCER